MKISIILTNEVESFSIDIEKALNASFEQLELNNNLEIKWCKESDNNWKEYFSVKSPAQIIEAVGSQQTPDIILCVFWSCFSSGVVNLGEDELTTELESVAADLQADVIKWEEKSHPLTRIFICERNSNTEFEVRRFVSNFRTALASKINIIWSSFKKKNTAQNLELFAAIVQFISDKVTPTNLELNGLNFRPLPPIENLNIPEGWIYVTQQFLYDKRNNNLKNGKSLNAESCLDFFDGREPTFEDALASNVPRREIVDILVSQFINATLEKTPFLCLITGAGGEGKSTILRQAAVDLVEQNTPVIHIIFRTDNQTSLNKEFLNDLHKRNNESFIIISDNAHSIISDLINYFDINGTNRTNVRFLMAAREADLRWNRIDIGKLNRFLGSNFHKHRIQQLSKIDANKITDAWSQANSLGELENTPEPERANKLFEIAKGLDNNSFLAALIKVRKNLQLNEFVEQRITNNLDDKFYNDKKLSYYFSYIAALHADGIYYLTKSVLRKVLKLNAYQLEEVINLLAEEAAIQESNNETNLVLARHQVIAEEARKILEQRFNNGFAGIIAELAVAAEEVAAEVLEREGNLTFPINTTWRQLPNLYLEKGLNEIAIFVAKEVFKVTPDKYQLNILANAYRKSNKLSQANELFSNTFRENANGNLKNIIIDKAFYTGWATTARDLNRNDLSVWLAAIALSDSIPEEERSKQPPLLRLSCLATAFSNLYKDEINSNLKIMFAKATKASIILGQNEKSLVGASEKYNKVQSMSNLSIANNLIEKENLENFEISECFNILEDLIKRVQESILPNKHNEVLIKLPQNLSFENLKGLFGINAVFKKPNPKPHIPSSRH